MNVATEIVEAIRQFEGKSLLRLTSDNIRRDRKMVESLDTYIVLNEIANENRMRDETELRTQIMIEYSKLQSERAFFSDETTSDHFSLVLFAIFNVKFDLNYANTDKLAEEIAGVILTAGTTFPINSATVLRRLFETYHEFGVDAEGLKAKINISLQNQYNIFRTDGSFSAERFRSSNIMDAVQQLFRQHFRVDLNLTMPMDPPPRTDLQNLIRELRNVERRLSDLERMEIPHRNDSDIYQGPHGP